MTNLELQKKALDIRKGIVTAVHSAKSGHPGGSLSAADPGFRTGALRSGRILPCRAIGPGGGKLC